MVNSTKHAKYYVFRVNALGLAADETAIIWRQIYVCAQFLQSSIVRIGIIKDCLS